MNSKHHKILHYLLVVLLMLAPLRSVFAGQMMACDMAESSSKASVTQVVSAERHCQNMKQSASADKQNKHRNFTKSCCDDNGACGSDCHIAVTISLFMSPADYSTALLNAVTFDNVSSSLLVRELIPPSRPPLALYS